MRRLSLILIMLSCLAVMASAQGNVDYNIIGAGARAHGMGGAFIGVADDATAVGWNPAGIAQLEKMEASVVGLFNIKKYSDEWTYGSTSGSDDNTESHIAPAFASFAFPLKAGQHNVVGAIAYQRMIDMGSVSSRDSMYDFAYYDYEDKISGGLDAITPAVGFQISPMFSLGAAGNILINGYEEKFDKTYSGTYRGTSNYKHNYTFSGFNFNAGALVNTQKFNVGLHLRFPFTLKQDYKYTHDWSWTVVPPSYTTATGSFTSPSEKTEISMPMMFGIGVAIKPTDKLTLAFDFESKPYSKMEVSGNGWTENPGYRNCNQIRAGLEYVITGNNSVFPLRLGFRTDPKVYNGSYGDGSDTSQAVGKVFTGGFGIIMGKVNLDLAYEFGMTNLADANYTGGSYKADEVTHTVLASCIFHF